MIVSAGTANRASRSAEVRSLAARAASSSAIASVWACSADHRALHRVYEKCALEYLDDAKDVAATVASASFAFTRPRMTAATARTAPFVSRSCQRTRRRLRSAPAAANAFPTGSPTTMLEIPVTGWRLGRAGSCACCAAGHCRRSADAWRRIWRAGCALSAGPLLARGPVRA